MKHILTLAKPAFFNFFACLSSLDRGYDECLYLVDKSSVCRIIRTDTRLLFIKITSVKKKLIIETDESNIKKHEIALIKDYVINWFDLNRDLAPFYQLLANNDQMKACSNKYMGLRLMGIVDLFEALCWCVIGQQINLTFAHKIKSRLVKTYGEQKSVDGSVYYCFPSPQIISKIADQELVEMQFSKQKIKYIKNISHAIISGKLSHEQLLNSSGQEQINTLMTINGVGPWTANYVSMKTLRNMSCIAYGDTGLSSALHQLFHTDKKPNIETINNLFKPFKGWESYFNFYLWSCLS